MDIWGFTVLLLDVVQATRVRLQYGCVMEHLVESDTEENDIELRQEGKKET